jgi:hypothetical protein
MIDVEPLIASSFERIFPQPYANADWDDVRRRAGVRSRRYFAIVAVVVALALAPAAWAITRAFEGKPAPPAVKSFFQTSNKMSAMMAKTLGRKAPRAIVSKAHGVIQVKTADGLLDLWAAPARGGGTCHLVAWQPNPSHPHTSEGGGCYAASAMLNNAESSGHNLDWSSSGDYWHRNYNVVTGYAYGDATTVRVTLSNGHTKTLPVVEHLFLGALHQSIHWRKRPKIVSLTARNTRGHIVGYWKRPPTR